MIYLLLLISFIIHVLTFVLIRQLKEKLNQPERIKQDLVQQQKEIEDLLAAYLLEMREENEKLQNLIDQDDQKGSVEVLKSKHSKIQDTANLSTQKDKYQNYQPIIPDEQEDIIEQSLEAQILSLHEKGDSVETIAKKLNRGKTEIELFIKFHQK